VSETVGLKRRGHKCDCNTLMMLKVLKSEGGHYLGYACGECGPYSRETFYYKNREAAQADLDKFNEGKEIAMERIV